MIEFFRGIVGVLVPIFVVSTMLAAGFIIATQNFDDPGVSWGKATGLPAGSNNAPADGERGTTESFD